MRSVPFERFAAGCAIVAGIGGLGYSAAFVTYLHNGSATAASILLLLGGLVVIPVFVGLYGRLREWDASFALVALALGIAAGTGTAVHGAYDLANLVKPPARLPGDLPNAVDPRGFLTFAVAGLGVLAASWIVLRSEVFPRAFGLLGLVAGVLLIYIYLGRLIILNPKNPALKGAAVLSGFVVNPLWFVWLGVQLRRTPQRAVELDPSRSSVQ